MATVCPEAESPSGSQAQLYLPAIDAQALLDAAQTLYPVQQLALIDQHTISCAASGVTFLPLPRGAALAAGLLSVELPPGIKKGGAYSILVRQLSGVRAVIPPPLPPPPKINTAFRSSIFNPPDQAIWQRVVGGFMFAINISTKDKLLIPEERLLATLLWMRTVTPKNRRWYPVLVRYLDYVEGRVSGFGGDPGKIQPSPIGVIPGFPKPPSHGHHPEHGHRLELTGKVDGIVHDHFGDFCGFILETELGRYHHYESREKPMQETVEFAWRERIRVTVISEPHEPLRPLSIVLRRGGR